MPRIDPIQLLNCLSVLLSPDGGIKSRDEVQRLAKLMTKFSKKLVSKCIYIQILKCTETDLLGLFMGSDGWRLVHMWLTESIVAKNWPLVRELLELLLLCPVDIERLKTNNCPKLVKELSKDGNYCVIRALATKLVEQWLKTVKGGEQVVPMHISEIQQIIANAQLEIKLEDLKNETSDNDTEKDMDDSSNLDNDTKIDRVDEETLDTVSKNNETDKDEQNETEVLPVLKITLKNGKQILSQVEDDSKSSEDSVDRDNSKEKQRSKSKDKDKNERSSSSSSSKSSSSKHSSKSSSSDKKNSHKESSSKYSSKDKSRDKDRRSSHSSKSKSSSSSSSSSSSRRSSSSSSKSKDDKSNKDKEKSKERDGKQSSEKSDDKVQSAISKLGKIPKLSDVKKEKLSISIEVRKPDEPKPKTVKTFNSKFRKHGLEEEMKPPPSRASLLSNKKPPPALPPTVSIPKRPSPVHNDTPPEKKPKPSLDLEKPGAIKLIPPKPKRYNGHHDAVYTLYICCNTMCGKSKMHNLKGLIIHVLKSYVKHLFIMKIKVKILITIF